MEEKEKGSFYWFWKHAGERVGSFVARHKFIFLPIFIALLVGTYMLRALYHPYVLGIREHSILFTFFLPMAIALWMFRRRIGWKKGIATWVLWASTLTILFFTHFAPVKYVALYWRYRTLDKVTLQELPTTAHERIQPMSSYITRSKMAIHETEVVAMPHLVRDGNEYRITIGIEPAYNARQIAGHVIGVFNISATSPSPDFSSKESKETVYFSTGEYLRFKKSVHVATIRSLPFHRYISYWPTTDVRYMKNDEKEWVQVVSLARWSGWFFPHKEFGGVIVIPQKGALKKNMQWIRPEDIHNYPFLTKQSIVPHEIARYIGLSFRFRKGPFAPMPHYHEGDLRIPDLADDVVQQPFTVHFDFPSKEHESKLYQYLGLEPYSSTKYGLAVSVFIPADSVGPVLEYPHADYQESLTGSSYVARIVKESNKIIDWHASAPVEHRPFIRKFAGEKEPRFAWFTTVVAKEENSSDKESRQFGGVNPDIVLVDAKTNTPVWVDAFHPEQWVEKLHERVKNAQQQQKQ